MPVQQRARGAADDHKLDATTKDKSVFPLTTSVVAKARRGGNHNHVKDTNVVLPSEADLSCQPHDGHNGVMTYGTYVIISAFANKWALFLQVDWSNMDTSVLNAYRLLHRLRLPSVFGSGFNERVLGRAGVCRRSPTMIRHKARRKTNKEQMALAVKKDFNDAMINELDSIATFLYSIHNKGTQHILNVHLSWLKFGYQTRAFACISHLKGPAQCHMNSARSVTVCEHV